MSDYTSFTVYSSEKFTGPNEVLLVLGRKTGAYREDCHHDETQLNIGPYMQINEIVFIKLDLIEHKLNMNNQVSL